MVRRFSEQLGWIVEGIDEYPPKHLSSRGRKTEVSIHIFEECAFGIRDDIRLEVEFPQGTINVPWPREAFAEEMLQRASPNPVPPEGGELLLEGNS